jgi:hypothetical protein
MKPGKEPRATSALAERTSPVALLALLGLVALLALLGPACGGPCRAVLAERRALEAPPAVVTADPHARVTIPFPVANRLIAAALQPPPEVPIPFTGLGPLASVVGEVRAIPREVTLGPSTEPGRVRISVRVELADKTGELLVVRASGDVAPTLEGTGDGDSRRLAIAFDPSQLSRLEPELGPRAAEQLGALLAARLPEAVRSRTPRFIIDRVATAVVEEAVDRGYRMLRGGLLPRLRDLSRINVELPDVPIARVALGPAQDALALDVFTTLPVRVGVAPPPPPEPDAIGVQIAGDAATRAANWGIAHGALPPRYNRNLKPAKDGDHVPHFEWRAGDPDRPLVVHMFRTEGSCSHFAVGVLPRVEVVDGRVRAWTDNRRLEQANAPVALELLARMKELVERSTSAKKQGPGSVRIVVGGRELTTRLLRA